MAVGEEGFQGCVITEHVQTHTKKKDASLIIITMRNVRLTFENNLGKPLFPIGKRKKKQNKKERNLNGESENVSYLLAFGCGILVHSVWKNVEMTITCSVIGVL